MTERIEYIDAMRGLAMVMVIVFHCCIFSFGHITPFCGIVNCKLQIPLFFMISGFFMQNAMKNKPSIIIKQKFIHLVIPALLMLGIYCWTFHKDYIFSIYEKMKMGYWFTLLLFGYIAIFLTITLLLRKLKVSQRKSNWIHIAVALIVSYTALIFNPLGMDYPWVNLFSIGEYFNYPFFVMGAILFPNRAQLFKTLSNKHLVGGGIFILILGTIAEALYDTEWLKYGAGLYCLIFRSLGLILIWMLFHRYRELSSMSHIGRCLSFIGKRSIDVYFLHYFFLPYGLHSWGDYLMSINAPLIEDLCAIVLSIPIIILSLGAGYIIRQSTITAKFLLGG